MNRKILPTMRPIRCRPDERGNALPSIIGLMAVMGIMTTTSLQTTVDDRLAAHNVRENTRAFYAAEAGTNLVLAEWDSLRYDSLMAAPGDSLDLGWQTLPENGADYRAVIHQVEHPAASRALYSLRVNGRSATGAASGMQILLRATNTWDFGAIPAAITAADDLRKNSTQGMNTGIDACTGDSLPGLLTQDLEFSDDPTLVFDGSPPVNIQPSPIDNVDFDWAEVLAADYDYVITNETQFPDFSSFPPDYYPSILVTDPRIDVDGSCCTGRGLLVVPNELRMNNGWEWDGLVLVGNFFQSNGNMTMTGAMFSGLNLQLPGFTGADISISAIGPGDALMTFDSCVLASVAAAGGGTSNGAPTKVAGSWIGTW